LHGLHPRSFSSYSPETFNTTELPYAREVCDAVAQTWCPTLDHKMTAVRRVVERCNQMPVHPRHPYAGEAAKPPAWSDEDLQRVAA
jgi:isopropylmalate/homocitrate/citramalate synthase